MKEKLEQLTKDALIALGLPVDKVEVTYTGWMDSLTRSTTYEDAGRHRVLITASDGKDKTEKEVYITVKERNRSPVFTAGAFE